MNAIQIFQVKIALSRIRLMDNGLLLSFPTNENNYLQALYEAQPLDSPEKEEFDAFSRLARDLTDTPIALVTLTDRDRQWFLSHLGIAERETSSSIAVCTHTIQSTQMLEIQDLAQNARFLDDPLVIGAPHIRFYAGVPLIVPSGQVIGTLCVLDTVVRKMTDKQCTALTNLANIFISKMELRRTIKSQEYKLEHIRVSQDKVIDLATRDLLTQLPNRMALYDRLGQQLRQSARDGGKFAFVYIDMDRFKLINDSLGHEAGDHALVEIAQRLKYTLRMSDTVARIGGDEFAAILVNIRDESDAIELAQKVNLALKKNTVLCGTELHYDASIGIAVYSDEDNVHTLINKADLAMYQAKRGGGGCSVLFTPAMEANASQLLSLEKELALGLQRDEIVAYYQPQITTDGKEIRGVEALVRWKHPRLGLLWPHEFSTLAESSRFSHRIRFLILDLAVGQLALWDAEGFHIPIVAVNIPQSEIKQGFFETVRSTLTRHQIAANRLEIEISESVLSTDRKQVILVLQQLRSLGVRISVIDFGSWNSSLGRLLKLPIDGLKLDRSFVTDIPSNETNKIIVAAMINMARSLGLHIVAAGAERAEQVGFLSAMGCDCVQGLIHTTPLSPHDFGLWRQDFLLQKNKFQHNRLDPSHTASSQRLNQPPCLVIAIEPPSLPTIA